MYRSLGSTNSYFKAIDYAADRIASDISNMSASETDIYKLNMLQRKMQAVATNRERQMKFIQRKFEREINNPSLAEEEKLEKNISHQESYMRHQFALAKWQNAANKVQESLFARQRARARA